MYVSSQPSSEEVEGASSSESIEGIGSFTEVETCMGICWFADCCEIVENACGNTSDGISGTSYKGIEVSSQLLSLLCDFFSFGLHHDSGRRDRAGRLGDTTVAHEGEILA